MTPARLAASDIDAAADRLHAPRENVQAVLVVETGGAGGFLTDGTDRPRILFEAHLFARFTGGRFSARYPNLSAPAWDRSLYLGGAREYERLSRASELDEAAARMATSWGLFQVLGQNFGMCGFSSVHAFVAAMRRDERAHLDAFLSFCEATGCADELARGDWAGFARIYNGPGYAANRYDTKLAAAAEEARRTGVTGGALAPAPAIGIASSAGFPDRLLRTGQRGESVRILQAKLNAAGASLVEDGIFGRATELAVERFQAAKGLVVDGLAGPATLTALFGAST